MFIFFIFIFLSYDSFSNEHYLKTENYIEYLLSQKKGLELAQAYYFLGKKDLALLYLNDSKDQNYLLKAKLYAKLGDQQRAIESVKKYIYNKNYDFKFNYFEEMKEILKSIGIEKRVENLGTFEEIVISYIRSNNFKKIFNLFSKNKKEIIKILSSQKNLNYEEEQILFKEGTIEEIDFYLFNNIKNFYDRDGYFKYFNFLEEESVVKLKTVLEEIMYYIYRNDLEQAFFVFDKELQKSRTSLEKYMLYMIMQQDFEENFEFPSDKYFYLYLKELKKRESKKLLQFIDLFLEKYEESKYLIKVLGLKSEFALNKIDFLNKILEKNFSKKIFERKLFLLAQEGRLKEHKEALEEVIKKFPIPKYVKMLKDILEPNNYKKEKQEIKVIEEEQNEDYRSKYKEAIENFNNSNYIKCIEILENLIENNTIDYKLINLYLKVCYQLKLKSKIRIINRKYHKIIDWYER